MMPTTQAKLTIYPDAAKPGRFLAIEKVGDTPGEMRITNRRITAPQFTTLRQALDAYCQEWGLTLVGRPKKVGTSLQVGVR